MCRLDGFRLAMCAGLMMCAGAIHTGRAHAFADLFRFNEPAAVGGGGGRWFTGSPADGYGCDVCHEGAASEQILVALPPKYHPGMSYEMYVVWPAAYSQVTAIVELTDEAGNGAGTVSVDQAPVAPLERCQPIDQGTPAALVFSGMELALANNRQLVGMQDCGGSVLHWRWTAPLTDIGPVVLSGGLVQPDQQKNAEGDRVARFFNVIGSPSQSARDVRVTAACSVRVPAGSSRMAWIGVLGFAVLLAIRLGRGSAGRRR